MTEHSDEGRRSYIGIRMEEELLARIDAFTTAAGMRVARSEVIRRALELGLAQMERKREQARRSRRK